MKGQWIGAYSGSNTGRILLDVDDRESKLEGTAFLTDSNPNLPTFRALLVVPKNKRKLNLTLTNAEFCVVDRFTGNPLPQLQIDALYKGLKIPQSANLEIDLDEKTLKLTWSTEIGTFGFCSLVRHDPLRASNLKTKANSWKNFKTKVSQLPARKFVFRGQSVVFRLRTSFHRNGRTNLFRFINDDIPTVHKHLSGRTRHYFNLQDADQNGAFLSLIQHHGYPTPLLDWTFSPFVSAFFAFRGITSEAALKKPKNKVRIFMFDREAWEQDMGVLAHLSVPFPYFCLQEFSSINNERMIPQQGISSVTNIDDIESYIEFCEKQNSKKYLQIYDLPWKERDAVIAELSIMGITAGSLFPGLDGACEEMKERMF
jgi:hypothetical protein